jgi:hypothetical protein
MRFSVSCHFFRRACNNDTATGIPAIRTQVDHPVCGFDHVHIVLDDQYGISFVDDPLEGGQKFFYVIKVEPGGGFVKYEEPRSSMTGLQVSRKLEALGLATREGVYGLAELHVTETHIGKRLKGSLYLGLVFEKSKRLINRHGKDIMHVLTLVGDLQEIFFKALSFAFRACDEDI